MDRARFMNNVIKGMTVALAVAAGTMLPAAPSRAAANTYNTHVQSIRCGVLLSSSGAYGWGSAYFPQYLVDPEERMVALFMTQLMPAGGSDLNQRFKVLVEQSVVK